MNKKEEYDRKRKALIQLSNMAKMLVKDGMYDTVNDAIIEEVYKKDGHDEFNTFYGWQQKGFRVKKGSKGFTVWGRPKKVTRKEAKDKEKDEFTHFPLAYLFSNKQVESIYQIQDAA